MECCERRDRLRYIQLAVWHIVYRMPYPLNVAANGCNHILFTCRWRDKETCLKSEVMDRSLS